MQVELRMKAYASTGRMDEDFKELSKSIWFLLQQGHRHNQKRVRESRQLQTRNKEISEVPGDVSLNMAFDHHNGLYREKYKLVLQAGLASEKPLDTVRDVFKAIVKEANNKRKYPKAILQGGNKGEVHIRISFPGVGHHLYVQYAVGRTHCWVGYSIR